MKYSRVLLPTLLLVLFSCKTSSPDKATGLDTFQYDNQKTATGNSGAVASAHPLASLVGLQVLKDGGNAIDAAIAMQLALAVVYPGAGNIGGGGFLVAHLQNGKNIALDFRETAPAAATRDMYLDAAGNAITDLSINGSLAAGIPGTVAGLFASMPYASLSFERLISPAIELAEKGFTLTDAEAGGLNEAQKDFRKYNQVLPVFVKDQPWKKGDTLVQKDLAATLKRIRDNGQKGFYEGETAKLIVAEMEKSKGIISLDDLKNYKAKPRVPMAFDYRGYEILSMPMPSSGGLIIQQCLKMMADKDLATMGFHTLASVQLMTEVERRAFADRAEYMGDPDFVKVPVATLASEAYLKQRMKDYQPLKAGNSQKINAGKIPRESEETTHLSVADKWGNLVSVTTTLNGHFGSKTVVAGAGFLLNNEMDDFSVKPGVPNMYGAVGGEANAIAPGKRMLSSMAPTIVLKDNKPFLVVGTPGGTTIPTSVLQSIVNIIDFNLSPADAVNQSKFHHQWLPDKIFVEEDFPALLIDSLKSIGYTVDKRPAIGRTELIKINSGNTDSTFVLNVVADKRGDDDARAY